MTEKASPQRRMFDRRDAPTAVIISSGSRQIRQAAAKSLSVSRTIDGATPRRRAILRVSTPQTNFNLTTSRSCAWLQSSLPALGLPTLVAKVPDPERARRGIHPEEHLPSVWSTRGERLKSERWAAQVRIAEGSHWSHAVPVTTSVRPTNCGPSRLRCARQLAGRTRNRPGQTRAGLCELRGVKRTHCRKNFSRRAFMIGSSSRE